MDYTSAIAFLERWAADRDLPPAEHAEFVRWMVTAPEAEREALLEWAMERALEWPDAASADPGLVARIEAALDAEGVEEMPMWAVVEPHTKRRIVRHLVGYAAAAVLIVLAGTSWWWLEHRGKPDQGTVVGTAINNDVAPGKNAAVLTLSGGKRIVLDSAADGLLARQGSTRIQKKPNGLLEYVPAGGVIEIKYNTLTTPRGGQYELTLPDGTNVWLNASSSITYPTVFAGKDRTVEVTGEAYFEVAHRADQPFRVKVGDELIEDLGTAFDVNAYADEPGIATTLVSGSVRVHSGKQSLLLSLGEQALGTPDGALTVDDKVDVDKTIAWKAGKFIFDRDDLPVILRQLSRWYDVGIQYQGSVPAGHFSGVISRNRNLSQVLDMLKATNNIHFTIEDKTIVILP